MIASDTPDEHQTMISKIYQTRRPATPGCVTVTEGFHRVSSKSESTTFFKTFPFKKNMSFANFRGRSRCGTGARVRGFEILYLDGFV